MIELILSVLRDKNSRGVNVKKFNPNKNIIIALILAIIVVAIVSITAQRRAQDGKITFGGTILNDTVGLIDKGLSVPGKAVHSSVQAVSNLMSTYQENERLKSKLDNYDTAIIQTKNQQKEIDELKKELNLNATLTSYEKITANVITRSPDTWQDMLVVDKGTNDGIEVNMAVMSQSGLVGRVIQVSQNTSKVELLTSSNQTSNHFPVRVSSSAGDAFGLLKDYDNTTQTFIVNQLTGSNELKEGDIVQTSGLGGNSPRDLLVGTVVKVKQDKSGLDREVYVRPSAQMYDISVVTIVKRLVEEGK